MRGVDLRDLERGYRSRTHIFQDLMRRRVRRLLIVSSVYDSFILEEDGGLDEGLVSEYVGLNLVHLPRMYRAATGATALSLARKERGFDLIITTHRLGDMDAHRFVEELRASGLDVPVVLLSYDSRDLEHLARIEQIAVNALQLAELLKAALVDGIVAVDSKISEKAPETDSAENVNEQ